MTCKIPFLCIPVARQSCEIVHNVIRFNHHNHSKVVTNLHNFHADVTNRSTEMNKKQWMIHHSVQWHTGNEITEPCATDMTHQYGPTAGCTRNPSNPRVLLAVLLLLNQAGVTEAHTGISCQRCLQKLPSWYVMFSHHSYQILKAVFWDSTRGSLVIT